MRRGLAFSALVIAMTGIATARAVSTDSVTIAATPPIVASQRPATTISGVVSSLESGEPVTVESKTCRARRFEAVARLRTTDGGAWSTLGPVVDGRTLFRASWRDTRSREVVVLVRPQLVLGQISRRLFRVILLLGVHANGKRLALQRFDADERAWKTVKTFVFTSPSTGWPQMTLSATVPKGAQLRLALPRAQARPCYLAGYSNLLGT